MILEYVAGPVIGAVIGYFTNFIAVKMLFHPKKEVKVFGHRLPFTPGAIPKGKPRLAKSVGSAVGGSLITQADIEEKLMSDELAGKIADAVLQQLEKPLGSLFEGDGISPEEAEAKKAALSRGIARFVAGSLAEVDFSGILMEKAPGIILSKLNNPMIQMFLTEELLQSVLAPLGGEIQRYIAEHGEEFITPVVEQKLTSPGDTTPAQMLEQAGLDREKLRQVVVSLYRKAVTGCADKLMEWLDLASIVEDKINAMSADELEALVMSVMKKELNTIVNLGALIGFLLGLLNIFF